MVPREAYVPTHVRTHPPRRPRGLRHSSASGGHYGTPGRESDRTAPPTTAGRPHAGRRRRDSGPGDAPQDTDVPVGEADASARRGPKVRCEAPPGPAPPRPGRPSATPAGVVHSVRHPPAGALTVDEWWGETSIQRPVVGGSRVAVALPRVSDRRARVAITRGPRRRRPARGRAVAHERPGPVTRLAPLTSDPPLECRRRTHDPWFWTRGRTSKRLPSRARGLYLGSLGLRRGAARRGSSVWVARERPQTKGVTSGAGPPGYTNGTKRVLLCRVTTPSHGCSVS